MDNFNQRKNDVLSKQDKSSKQSWDKRIVDLCEGINSSPDYYTTSSCSGRIVLIKNTRKKEENLFVGVWHDLVSFGNLKKVLDNCSGISVKFKQEPVILHVACRDLGAAQRIHDFGKLAGWKRSGIVASGKRFVVELNSTEKLEFPIVKNGKLLVSDEFLEEVLKEANENLEKGWEKIRRLRGYLRVRLG